MNDNLTDIKQDHQRIYDAILGAPVRHTKTESVYHVPWRSDSKASLSIRKSDGRWFDNSRAEDGDVLDFVQRVFHIDRLPDAIQKANEIRGSSSSTPHPIQTPKPQKEAIFPVPADAPTPPEHPSLGLPAMRWPYKNRLGQTIFYVCRFEKNDSKIPMPLAYYETGWEYELRREWYPLFGLELLEKFPSKEVLIVEGEKAALAGRLIFPDMVVMCWHGGTNRVESADFTPLKNRRVTLWADNDKPGEEAMDKVVNTLSTVGLSELFRVRIPRAFPHKWDLADEIPEGADLHWIMDRRARIGKVKFNPMPSTSLARKKYQPMEWIVDGILPEGLTLLSAPGKIGKTFFCQELCLCLAAGRDFLGIPVKRGRAVYVDGEQNYRLVQKRLRDLGWPDGADGMDVFCEPGFQLDDHGLSELDEYMERHADTRLVVVDTLQRLIPQPEKRGGMDAYQSAVAQMSPIQEWVQRHNLSMVIVHHTKKGVTEGGEAYDDASGSRGYTGTAETLLTFKRAAKDDFKLSVVSRHGVSKELAMTREGVHWKLIGDFEEAQLGNERGEILELLRLYGAMGPSAIAKELDKNKGTISRQLKKMAALGLVQYVENGTYIARENGANCGTIVVD